MDEKSICFMSESHTVLFCLVFAGAVLVDQYCNPLADVTLESISAQLDDITEKVKKYLRVKNAAHPSLRSAQGKQFYSHILYYGSIHVTAGLIPG